MLRVDGIIKSFGRRRVLGPVGFDLAAGERVILAGPSGCGKSTLLRLIAGLERPDAGTIEMNGARVSDPGCLVPPRMRDLGMVFQSPALWPHMTVAENIGFALQQIAASERRPRVLQMLETIGLAGFAGRYPDEVSGGEAQRIAILRALAPEPRLLLLDEPFSNLDPENAKAMLDLIRKSAASNNAAIVHVSHDSGDAGATADRVLRMKSDGTLE